MQTQSNTIVGYFQSQTEAQRAVEALQQAGFTSAHVGVAHRGSSSNWSDSSARDTSGTRQEHDHESVWGKMKNFFGGDAEPYADEQRYRELANREVTPNPADQYSSGSYAGSDTGRGYDEDFHQNFTSMDVPEDRSRYFSDRFRSGSEGAIVTVNAGDRNAEAESILRQYGADMGENAASYRSNTASADLSGTDRNLDRGQASGEGMQNIQLLGELLRVHKDRVNRGEVRIRKEIVTENQTVQVPVTREELVIERHAVNGETPASGSIGSSQEIRIPLTEETASIDKATVVREEVTVGKRATTQNRDLSGEVRHEELVVDDQSRGNAQNDLRGTDVPRSDLRNDLSSEDDLERERKVA